MLTNCICFSSFELVCLLVVPWYVLFVVCCAVFVVGCSLIVVGWLLIDVCCLSFVCCWLCVACVACWLLVLGDVLLFCLFAIGLGFGVACCVLVVDCCLLSVVCCVLCIARGYRLFFDDIPDCFFSVCRLLYVV